MPPGPGADEAETDQEQAGQGDAEAVDRQLSGVLPDLPAPAPAVLVRVEQQMVVVDLGCAALPRGYAAGQGGGAMLSVDGLTALAAG